MGGSTNESQIKKGTWVEHPSISLGSYSAPRMENDGSKGDSGVQRGGEMSNIIPEDGSRLGCLHIKHTDRPINYVTQTTKEKKHTCTHTHTTSFQLRLLHRFGTFFFPFAFTRHAEKQHAIAQRQIASSHPH